MLNNGAMFGRTVDGECRETRKRRAGLFANRIVTVGGVQVARGAIFVGQQREDVLSKYLDPGVLRVSRPISARQNPDSRSKCCQYF